MDTIRARLADALRVRGLLTLAHADKLAGVLLSTPGIAIVELPDAHEESTWYVGDVGDVIADPNCGGVRICGVTNNLCTTAAEAREFASALLAAAVQAQEEQ